MTRVHILNKGLDIRIEGGADTSLQTPSAFCKDYAIRPKDFWDIRPKLLVSIGDRLKAGSALFYDKNREEIKVCSPVSGTVANIVYGEKRQIENICIEADETQEYEQYTAYKADEIARFSKEDREKIKSQLLASGLWAFIKRRPYQTIANPNSSPRDIFISCFDSSPLAADMDMIVHGREEAFQAGVDVLRQLTDGQIYLSVHKYKNSAAVYTNCKRAEVHVFDGAHPSGNVGVQIHHIAPISKGEEVWYVHPQDVIAIGNLFLKGVYDATKIVSVGGSELSRTGYYRVKAGVNAKYLLYAALKDREEETAEIENWQTPEDIRIISGSVLTGKDVSRSPYLGAYDHYFSVLPEGNNYKFMGWLALGINSFSFSRSFFSWIFKDKNYKIDTNLNGGKRAYVLSGEFEKVLPMDIYPLELIKACITKDIEKMEDLGIYEVAPEDFALCEYIDASKNDIQEIIRQALDLIRKEND